MRVDLSVCSSLADRLLQMLARTSVVYYEPMRLFVVSSDGFEQHYNLVFIKKHDRIIVEPGMGIRSNGVEEVFNRWSGHSEAIAAHTSTIGGLLRTVFGRRFDVTINRSRDINSAAGVLAEWYCEFAIPFFQSHSSLESMYDVLNSCPTQPCAFANDLARASRGLILAAMLHRDAFDDLFVIYDERIKRWGEPIYNQQWLPLIAELNSQMQ